MSGSHCGALAAQLLARSLVREVSMCSGSCTLVGIPDSIGANSGISLHMASALSPSAAVIEFKKTEIKAFVTTLAMVPHTPGRSSRIDCVSRQSMTCTL